MVEFKVFKKICKTGELVELGKLTANDVTKAFNMAVAQYFTQINMMKELIVVEKSR